MKRPGQFWGAFIILSDKYIVEKIKLPDFKSESFYLYAIFASMSPAIVSSSIRLSSVYF